MKKPHIKPLIAALIVMSCIPGSVLAAPLSKHIKVSGTVSDYVTHNPIESVVISTNVLGTSYRATTDNAGRYSLDIRFIRKPALIILVASKKGYLPSVKLISKIQPGRSYTANFSMRDITPPSRPVVTDDGEYLVASGNLHAKWFSEDSQSGIKEYRYSIGTRAGSTDVVRWTSAGANTEITLSNLNLRHGRAYFFNVRAISGVNLPSVAGSSDGIIVNSHIPEITRIIPYNDTTLVVGDGITIEATARDLDNDPIEYQFSMDGQVKQPFSSSNAYSYTVEPSISNTHVLKVEIRDDKNGLASQEVSYRVQSVVIDTTPPPAPSLTTNSQSSSLDSIEAQWSSEDPESGIMEYQYAIGTTPGGTDVLYWTTYGNNTQAYLYGLNLTKGSQYYLSVVAKNGAGLKSPVSTSPAITAQKEPYIKIYYPYQNAIITDRESKVKGVAEGLTQITINGKTVSVNGDGSFEGPTLVAPGYAKWFNVADDNDHIIMKFPGETNISAEGAGQEDVVTFFYYQFFMKNTRRYTTTDSNANPTYNGAEEIVGWNSDALVEKPIGSSVYQVPSPSYNSPIAGGLFYRYVTHSGYNYAEEYYQETWDGSLVIHTLPQINGKIEPMIITFLYCRPNYNGEIVPSHLSYKIGGKTINLLSNNWYLGPYAWDYQMAWPNAYITLTDYQPDTDVSLDIDYPIFSQDTDTVGGLTLNDINLVMLETVREVPYGSANYVKVDTIPIFQPDDGKGRGPSTELLNMPFLALKFNEEPSNSQANTLEAKLTIAKEAKTYNLTETAVDSNVFVDPDNGFTVTFDSPPITNSNAQDELTCEVTSSLGSISDKLFNLKESASDSLYFSDVKTFITVIFDNELLSYQQDTLTIQYENGMLASEETLTETSADSLVFSNEDGSFTVNLNNYQGTLPDSLYITINNQDYIEISKAELKLPKVNDSPYVYTNEPIGEGSDLPPNNPLDDGQGIFKIRVRCPHDTLRTPFQVDIATDSASATLPLFLERPDYYKSKVSSPTVLLSEGCDVSYDGINTLCSASGEGKITVNAKDYFNNSAAEVKNDTAKGAFVGTTIPFLEFGWYIRKHSATTSDISEIIHERLGYTSRKFEWSITGKEFLEALPNNSVWYSSSHGFAPHGVFRGIPVWSYSEQEGSSATMCPICIFPEQVRDSINGNSYKLVFLNACLSGQEDPSGNADEFLSAFNAGKYMGWKIESEVTSSGNYAKEFFTTLDKLDPITNKPYTIKAACDKLEERKFTYADKINCLGPKDDIIDLAP